MAGGQVVDIGREEREGDEMEEQATGGDVNEQSRRIPSECGRETAGGVTEAARTRRAEVHTAEMRSVDVCSALFHARALGSG